MRGDGLAFAAFVAGLESARVPKLVVRVRSAEPAITFLAEQRRGGVARLIQMRYTFAKRLGSLAEILFGRLCLHGRTCGDILLLPGLERDGQSI